ncbi:hypothetical protein RhiirA4_471674 [Rhizophagus irregularis]|uniref:Uncharacterized protein n=1 Tax=Rhizophagus irregularis TaxID=588596 RepID=A0A2I1H3J7_9GLOM|nr:hypothetical protein RhiirA4_471674 [Rhizophagus irregularis]
MSDKLHDLPLITFIMLRHAFSFLSTIPPSYCQTPRKTRFYCFDNRASLSYFVNIPNAEVVVNPSTSRSIPTYLKTPQRGYEIGMVELSGGYLTFDMPRYLKDHIKGFCGCRDLLNDICLRYSLGDFKIMRHLRVWFLHCHGLDAHASLQCNRKKRTYDDADLYMYYGYACVDWVITKVQNGIGRWE